jgi:hypothetical protein
MFTLKLMMGQHDEDAVVLTTLEFAMLEAIKLIGTDPRPLAQITSPNWELMQAIHAYYDPDVRKVVFTAVMEH